MRKNLDRKNGANPEHIGKILILFDCILLVTILKYFLFSEVEISQNFRRKNQNAILLLQNKDQSHQKNPGALVLVEAWKILTNFTKWPHPHPPKNLGKVMPAKEKKGNNKKKSPKAQILTMRAFWIYLQINF